MNPSDGALLPHGGYEKLRSYKVAEAVYDATVVFCDRFIDKRSRTHDQMVQAARSGVRNISEGSGAAATSRKSEMKLTNVARASLNDELLSDYRSFLSQHGLPVWPKDSPQALAMRERTPQARHRALPAARQTGHSAPDGVGRPLRLRGTRRPLTCRKRHVMRRESGRLAAQTPDRESGTRISRKRRLQRKPLPSASKGTERPA